MYLKYYYKQTTPLGYHVLNPDHLRFVTTPLDTGVNLISLMANETKNIKPSTLLLVVASDEDAAGFPTPDLLFHEVGVSLCYTPKTDDHEVTHTEVQETLDQIIDHPEVGRELDEVIVTSVGDMPFNAARFASTLRESLGRDTAVKSVAEASVSNLERLRAFLIYHGLTHMEDAPEPMRLGDSPDSESVSEALTNLVKAADSHSPETEASTTEGQPETPSIPSELSSFPLEELLSISVVPDKGIIAVMVDGRSAIIPNELAETFLKSIKL